jgi:hypothetical protein
MSGFSKDIFNELDEVYRNMDIPSEMQVDEFDIDDMMNINEPNDLQPKITNIQNKIEQSQNYITEQQGEFLQDYK